MSCSLKKWFCDLPWMQQGVLLSAIRNCDNIMSEGPHKILVRGIRAACIKSAQTKGSFNARRPTINNLVETGKGFVDNHNNHMPVHFVTHIMHAAEVIGYSHPDNQIATGWLTIYHLIVKTFHLNPETKEEFIQRLKDNPEQVGRENRYDEKCYRTGDYGNGTGTINENI